MNNQHKLETTKQKLSHPVFISMSIGMDSKSIISLALLAISLVSCQYVDVSHLINSTQHLQDIERGEDWRYQNIYPKLNMSEHDHGDQRKNQSILIPTTTRPLNVSKPSLDKFINKTLSSMPSGVCVKEVP